jgi:hypothetical protein
MVPPLRQYLNGLELRDNDDFALHRLFELSPEDARALILADARRTNPRFSVRDLAILPEKELPELDTVLAANLQHDGTDLERVAQLIQRYASPAVESQVADFYDASVGRWACAIQDSLLAYMLRVRPEIAVDRIRSALRMRKTTGCYRTLLFDLAQKEPAKDLQPLAITALDDSEAWVAVTAANSLAIVGDDAAKQALFRRLQSWYREWMGREDELAPKPGRDWFATDAPLGDALFRALVNANNWLLTDAEVERASDLLVGDTERQQSAYLIAAFRERPVPLSVSIDAMNINLRVGSFECRSMDLLKHRLDLYQPGTAFQASPVPAGDSSYEREMKELSDYLAKGEKRLVFAKP